MTTFDLNATGRAWASKTGWTKLGLREGHDALNHAFVGASGQYDQLVLRTADYAGTTSDPILEVDYAVATPVDTTFSYDQDGRRLTQSDGTTVTHYVSADYNHSKQGGTVTDRIKHVSAAGMLVATVQGTGAAAVRRHAFTDHLTGTSVVTSATGAIEEVVDYLPYGAMRVDQKTGAYSEQRKYAGHEFDAGTGLSYMKARYYDAGLGRFLSQDAAFLAVGDANLVKDMTGLDQANYLANPQHSSAYSYAFNNPLVNLDPGGDFAVKTFAVSVLQGGKALLAVASIGVKGPLAGAAYATGRFGLGTTLAVSTLDSYDGGIMDSRNAGANLSNAIFDKAPVKDQQLGPVRSMVNEAAGDTKIFDGVATLGSVLTFTGRDTPKYLEQSVSAGIILNNAMSAGGGTATRVFLATRFLTYVFGGLDTGMEVADKSGGYLDRLEDDLISNQ